MVPLGEVAPVDLAVADDIGMSIARLHRLLACVSTSGSKAGMDRPTFMLLATLAEHGPRRSGALAETLHSDPSTVSRQVAQLVKAGLARREADPVDGRASRLAVTDTGLTACQRLHEARHALLSEALSDWPPERITAFADLFTEFNSSVEALLRRDPAATSRENA